jgi:trehalose synthase-fused probable maltokinase
VSPRTVPPDTVRDAVAALTADGLAEERWFGSKGAELGPISVVGTLGPFGGSEWLLALGVGADTYLVPAAIENGRIAEPREPLWQALAEACRTGATLRGDGAELHGSSGPLAAAAPAGRVRPLGVDQSNTSVVLGEQLVLKCYRRLTPGAHPEIELTRYLARHGLASLPAVHGSADIRIGGTAAGALLLQDYVADGRDGWLAAEHELRTLLETADVDAAAAAPRHWAPAVGKATAELHALLAVADEPGFTPRPATRTELTALRAAADAQLDEALALLEGEPRAGLERVAPILRERFGLFESATPPLLTRVHGDLHLGQFLSRVGRAPALVDFEGEPTRPADERRLFASPLRDLAGLLRSVDHAAHSVSDERSAVADAWVAAARRAIRLSYERRLAELRAPFAVDPQLLTAFEADKAVYEFIYAVKFLPSWLDVPRRALGALVETAR